uniref:CS domain-containing protein n=1 Tax=Globisporangium ultimum (strain ATCC 200006 / CBS 805.95 / DAOM BR144) TaxID=431595 RepID=K3X7G9_GLOUD
MVEFFLPYVYVPSADASYVKIVTPLGELHLERDAVGKILVSVTALLVTLVLYCVCFTSSKKSKKSKKKKNKAKEPQLKPRGVNTVEEEDSNSEDDDDDSDSDEDPRSALDESLIRKGEHSYYYAHQHRDVKDADDADAIKKTMISTYGWTDGKETVSIFLRDDAVKGMQDEQLVLKWTKTSFSLNLLTAPKGMQAKSLVIPTLYSNIKRVDWKVKKNQLTLTLTKEKIMPWKSLNGAAKNLEDHIEYDESLFD